MDSQSAPIFAFSVFALWLVGFAAILIRLG